MSLSDLIALFGVLLTCGTTLIVGLYLHSRINEVRINVDGRLEAALVKVDLLELKLAKITGEQPPPGVSGMGGVKP